MRRLFSGLLALLLIVGTGSIVAPANATAFVEYVYTDYFYIYKGGGPAVSEKFMRKNDNGPAMYTCVSKYGKSTIEWYSSETVYWRGRSESLAKATELGSTNVETERELYYLSGYGTYGSKYTIAAEYASDNPYNRLEVIISWCS